MKFSVLLSVYHKEKAMYLNEALSSIYDHQSCKPHEIVLVEDGPLTDELYEVITYWKKKLGSLFTTVCLQENVGLGEALNIGLSRTTYDIVARMDSDDIAHADRFMRQITFLKENREIDLVGSWVNEFDTTPQKILSVRKTPEYHSHIIKFAKRRNPLSHPSVMFRKQSVLDAGGYLPMLWFEDYYLWVRMIQNGAILHNLQIPLLDMRAGFKQLERRSGKAYAHREVIFQKKLLELSYITKFEYFINIIIRGTLRMYPKFVVKFFYKLVRKF